MDVVCGHGPGLLRAAGAYLKSRGRRSCRWHFSHTAMFLSLPLLKTDFIVTSPPQGQANFWVLEAARAFLLT
jgi:hypothetical protein